MGKSNNPQPGHSLADAGAAACHAQVLPSKLPGVPTSQPQPSSFPASSSTKPFTQPKPSSVSALGHASSSSLSISPLTATLSSSPVPVYPDTNLDFVPPLSPTDDDDIFYDAEDNLFEVPPAVSVKPVRASGVQQVQAEPFLEGASKGRMGVSAPRATARSGPYPCTPVPVYSPLPTVRGSSKPSVSLSAAQPPPTPLASRVPSLFASPLSSSLTAQRQPIKRALLIGINYHNLHETKRLQHATKDARRFGATLAEAASFKEIQLITDDNALGPPPTRENILQRFDWLVRDAKAGDQLVVLFSGHCAYVNKTGPYLVAAGNSLISKEDLAHRLLSKLPAQCKLNVNII
ncbi:hypothetical protein BDV93DRAFT_243052 [Ceratobasidium sp. AG-I]|nr:hypothetical protein BDV93DRAFT_243052 [Ceratobasidium sp. AG-I]